jgi:hypothetical protein
MLIKMEKVLDTPGDIGTKDIGTPPTTLVNSPASACLKMKIIAHSAAGPKKVEKLPFEELHESLKYRHYFRVETHPNGGARTLHAYQEEIDMLSPEEADELAHEFFQVLIQEFE